MAKKLKMFFIKMGIASIGFFISLSAMAQQDYHFSQFDASPLSINPATTGVFNGSVRGHIQHRQQWRSVTRNPFITDNAAFDFQKKKFGLGLNILNNKAGANRFNTLYFSLSTSYEVTRDRADIHHLICGVQLGFINKSINLNNATFDNQYNSANGGAFDPNISSDEYFQQSSYIVPELSFGLYYYTSHKIKKVNPYIGVSGFHLTEPQESFLGTNSKVARKYVGYGGTKIKISELNTINASFLFMQQANIQEVSAGFMDHYYLSSSDAYLLLGAFYRYKDAVILHTGLIYKDVTLRFSYDINISSLNGYSKGRGGFEISITYIREKKKFIPSIF